MTQPCRNCGPNNNWKPGQKLRGPITTMPMSKQPRLRGGNPDQVNDPFSYSKPAEPDKIRAAELLYEVVKDLPVKLAAARALKDGDPDKVKSVNEILREISTRHGMDTARAFMAFSLGKPVSGPDRDKLLDYFKDRTDFMGRLMFQKLKELR